MESTLDIAEFQDGGSLMDKAVYDLTVSSLEHAREGSSLAAQGVQLYTNCQRTKKGGWRAGGLLLLLALLAEACAGGPLTTREKGALVGGGIGAGAGALIHGGTGAAIGGALGALSGGLIGDQLQGQEYRQAGQQRQINRQQRELNRQRRELRRLQRRQAEEDY